MPLNHRQKSKIEYEITSPDQRNLPPCLHSLAPHPVVKRCVVATVFIDRCEAVSLISFRRVIKYSSSQNNLDFFFKMFQGYIDQPLYVAMKNLCNIGWNCVCNQKLNIVLWFIVY